MNNKFTTNRHVFLWIILAFFPAALTSGITEYISDNIAFFLPILWIWGITISLYFITFIMAFRDKEGFFSLRFSRFLQVVFIFIITSALILDFASYKILMIFLHIGLFYFTCLVCHKELYNLRPDKNGIIKFYLAISFGATLGFIFMMLIAPRIFTMPIEYTLILVGSLFFRFASESAYSLKESFAKSMKYIKENGFSLSNQAIAFTTAIIFAIVTFIIDDNKMMSSVGLWLLCVSLLFIFDCRWRFAISAGLVLLLHPANKWELENNALYKERNIFGNIRVYDITENINDAVRIMQRDNMVIGVQAIDNKHKNIPLSYYSENSAIADVMAITNDKKGQIIGSIGLGVGSISSYKNSEREFDFFEINPAIIDIAKDKKYFTYISDCGDRCNIYEGNVRVRISEQPKEKYDVIVVDIFSLALPPTYLIAKDSIQVYLDKLKDDGYLLINISNKYSNLEDDIFTIAQNLGVYSAKKFADGGIIEGTDLKYFSSQYVVIAKNKEKLVDLVKISNQWKMAE